MLTRTSSANADEANAAAKAVINNLFFILFFPQLQVSRTDSDQLRPTNEPTRSKSSNKKINGTKCKPQTLLQCVKTVARPTIANVTSDEPPTDQRETYQLAIKTGLPHLMQYARQLTWPNHDHADDLVQEAVIKGYRYFIESKLQLNPGLTSWLKTAIHQEFLMSLRRSRRTTSIEDGQLDAYRATTSQPFEGSLSDAINRAISSLPEDQRAVVVLIDIQQLEYQEASDILEVPIGTIRSRLSRARWKLANKLQWEIQNS